MAQAFQEKPFEPSRILDWPGAAFSVRADSMRAVAEHYAAAASRVVWTKQHLFDQLTLEWREGTFLVSSLSDIVAHPSYQRIIGMGQDALPYILDELRRAPDHWHWALVSITGANPVPPESSGDLERMRQAWLSWASSKSDVLHG
ncbi:MAG: hypothetical protein Q8K32_22535 [Archangium sp.]|nr:hypothetical protein [Archangium sp.]